MTSLLRTRTAVIMLVAGVCLLLLSVAIGSPSTAGQVANGDAAGPLSALAEVLAVADGPQANHSTTPAPKVADAGPSTAPAPGSAKLLFVGDIMLGRGVTPIR